MITLFAMIKLPMNMKTNLTLKRLGGGGHDAISRNYSATRKSSRRDTVWQFSFEFPAHFDIKFVMAEGTVPKLRNIVYMHVGPKNGSKMWFCVQNQCKLSFYT